MGEKLANIDKRVEFLRRHFGQAVRPDDFERFLRAKTPRQLERAVQKLFAQGIHSMPRLRRRRLASWRCIDNWSPSHGLFKTRSSATIFAKSWARMPHDPLTIPMDSPALNVGVFNTAESKTVVSETGFSGLFHFPFRIYAQEELDGYSAKGDGFRFRVHAPFLVRRTGASLTDDVPKEMWPEFRWHEAVPEEMRRTTTAPDLYYQTPLGENAIWYDGIRFDFWRPNAANRISSFVMSAMRWLRFFSGQPWISDVDRHYGSTLRRSFPIDDTGAAVHEVVALMRLRPTPCSFVNNQMWKSAFNNAAQVEVPTFYNLYFDGINAAAVDDYPRAVMTLAMALEGSRDHYFSKIHPSEFLEGRGPRLKAPFHLTDLLKHMSVHSRTVFARDFSEEHPTEWPHIRNLYLARQNVAHGKGAVFPQNNGLTSVDIPCFLSMQKASWIAFQWMDDVSKAAGQ